MKNLFRSTMMALLFSVPLFTGAQVPVMNSYPTATAVLFLDFDGHTLDNTAWNYNGPIVCDAAGMTNTNIVSVFNRVAEDYRPFNINVTTEEAKYLAAPIDRRMRVVLTVSHQWYGAAGGVAFVGSFTWGDDTPCFVFTAALGVNWVKAISEAAAHEAGHTLGLYHQARYDANCVKISDYHSGNGAGEIGWAPIMGVGYYQNLTLWNNGPNPYGCTNYQSDLSVITTSNGFSFRTDEHPSNFVDATSIPFTNNQFLTSGVITQSTDQDMIKFVQPGNGRFVLNAVPYNVGTGNEGSDLDMQVTLYDATQAQLNVYNPGTLLSSIVDTSLNAGTYYIKVEGRGNIYAPNYASLGSYSLQGNYFTSTLPLRRLELSGAVVNEKHRLNWFIDADEQVVEQVLEFTTNGRNFISLSSPAAADRLYLYTPMGNNAVQYRLKVTFDNGRTYYSNVITLRNVGTDNRPKLLTNLVNGTITVTSPGSYSYEVVDFTGKQTAKGQLSKGMNYIPASAMASGMYVIRFSDQSNQWTDKLVRQ